MKTRVSAGRNVRFRRLSWNFLCDSPLADPRRYRVRPGTNTPGVDKWALVEASAPAACAEVLVLRRASREGLGRECFPRRASREGRL